MAHKKTQNYKMIVVKSKLKIPAYKPEVQLTDMTSVYEICQKSQVGYVLTCHSLRMHFWLFSLLFKGNFQSHRLVFRKCKFSKFCKNSKFSQIQNVLLLFRYCHDADHMYNEISLKMFIDNQFFPKKCNFTLFHSIILHYHPHYWSCCKVKVLILELTKNNVWNKNSSTWS